MEMWFSGKFHPLKESAHCKNVETVAIFQKGLDPVLTSVCSLTMALVIVFVSNCLEMSGALWQAATFVSFHHHCHHHHHLHHRHHHHPFPPPCEHCVCVCLRLKMSLYPRFLSFLTHWVLSSEQCATILAAMHILYIIYCTWCTVCTAVLRLHVLKTVNQLSISQGFVMCCTVLLKVLRVLIDWLHCVIV